MAHTQGPWAVSNYYAGKASISGENWGGFATVVTRLDGDENEYSEGLANAHLIAAAPDLLAALTSALDALDDSGEYPETARLARAAITKSRGARK